ncbi:hypothetical protein EUA93_20410 [Nocardioides oleivorans]|uniref:Uncharacterized protein n=1 Tax=Nocardioides oleivorans TaxID=273676 RepID=A0A4Q2RPF9_9ACTN|nr:hypothetical protein [Nocardioides oleivorans]RYB90508.1 hypothetical protein EUA93_20410 [Nocardioides oleivorans]
MSRVLTLVLAVGFAVVGIAGAASAHHNTITGSVICKTGGGWAVTWSVVNSETLTETITASNRTNAVPVGSQLTNRQTRNFTETITTKPTSAVALTLSGKWTNGQTATNTGSIDVAKFSDACNVTTVEKPAVPVVDDCGPGNAHYGTVPSGPWTSVVNPDGSLTVTATPGYQFTGGTTSFTLPVLVDSNVPCPSTPPTTTPPTEQPPVITPPVVQTPPEVLPAQVRVVQAAAKKIDKCGTRSDLFKVVKRAGVIYKANGKIVQKGVWIKAKSRTVTIKAIAADQGFRLKGQQTWKMTFTTKACAQAPQVAPATGG